MSEVSVVSTAWAVFGVVGGSLLGAVISAVVSFLIQRKNIQAAQKQREEDRFETRRACAYSLFFKMMRIHSTIALLGKSVSETIRDAEASGIKGTICQKLLPLGNLPPRVKFAAEEMALLLSLDFNLFNDVGPYDDVHNSLLDLFELYGTKRHTLTERFGAKLAGSVGTTSVTETDLDWMAPRAFELNGLAEIMIERTKHDSDESKDLLVRIHALFVKEFKLNPKLEFIASDRTGILK